MNKTINPIPTKYNGILFRSRLEARWAVFFDYMNLKYFYEYEGFQLPRPMCKDYDSIDKIDRWETLINYVPDFYIPKMVGGSDYWFEVKPIRSWNDDWTHISKYELAKINRFGNFLEDNSRYGIIGDLKWCADLAHSLYDDNGPEFARQYKDGSDAPYYFCRCPKCGKIGFEFEGRMERSGCCKEMSDFHKYRSYGDEMLQNAYSCAQKYRFI